MRHIALFIPALNVGGLENLFIAYANKLEQKGYRVDLVLCKTGGALEHFLSPNVTKVDLGCVRVRKAYLPLRHYLKKQRPNIIISCSTFASFMAILAASSLIKKPKVAISQQAYLDAEIDMLGFLGRRTKSLMKLLFPHADQIFTVSQGTYDFVLNEIKVPGDKLLIINNPIDLSTIQTKAEERLNGTLPANYIAFVGRFSPVKNISLVLRAFDQVAIPDLELVLVGDGPETASLKQIASTCQKVNLIHFIGALANPYPVLKNAKAMVLTSYSEGFPTVIMEAMAVGKTTVSTPTKGAKEVLGAKFDKYISQDFEDADAFARLIEEAIQTPYPEDLMLQEAQKHDVDHAVALLEEKIILVEK
ncbi:MAG: glycosyltransferase [Candidatus Symbiothrix sp.]|jgi:glycosyltransferase involved in cell wall biosynthesis|nr:glycosyltransferase [Candidatus Symbiothrix sp.]